MSRRYISNAAVRRNAEAQRVVSSPRRPGKASGVKPCRDCGAPIKFELVNGGWVPVNLDGKHHLCNKPLPPT